MMMPGEEESGGRPSAAALSKPPKFSNPEAPSGRPAAAVAGQWDVRWSSAGFGAYTAIALSSRNARSWPAQHQRASFSGNLSGAVAANSGAVRSSFRARQGYHTLSRNGRGRKMSGGRQSR